MEKEGSVDGSGFKFQAAWRGKIHEGLKGKVVGGDFQELRRGKEEII